LSCGGGRSSRHRSCSAGSGCSGADTEARVCNSNTCPTLVTWSSWGSWTSCTKTCGRGRSDRYRSCPSGSTCSGERSETRWCNTNTCPAVATWSNWGPWSECTQTCGRGRSDRYRSCSGSSTCQGETSEARWCNTNTCPENFVPRQQGNRRQQERFNPWNCHLFAGCNKKQLSKQCHEVTSRFGFLGAITDSCVLNSLN